MQWKPKQVILRVYFMYTVNEMRLGELVKTVLHSEHPNPPPPLPRKDFWSFLITPFPSLTEMSSSFNSPLYHHMTSENQVQVAPCKQILVPESIREIMPVETGIRNPASDRNPISTVEKLIGPSKIHCNGNRNPQPGIQYVLDWFNWGDTRFDCACVVCL